MGADQLQALARDIVAQTVQHAWGYWLVVVGLLVVATFVGSLIGSYAAKRGEHAAVDADLKKILGQLEQTTQVTEGIRSVVALGEWSERERRTLRRMKLEELLLNAHKAKDRLDSERNRLVFLTEEPKTPSPQPLMAILGKLYFPDLRQQIYNYDIACDRYDLKLLNIHQELFQVKADATAAALVQFQGGPGWEENATGAIRRAQYAIRERSNAELLAGYQVAVEALYALDTAAAAAMAAIIDAPPDVRGSHQ